MYPLQRTNKRRAYISACCHDEYRQTMTVTKQGGVKVTFISESTVSSQRSIATLFAGTNILGTQIQGNVRICRLEEILVSCLHIK
jgi:hypothetical protein